MLPTFICQRQKTNVARPELGLFELPSHMVLLYCQNIENGHEENHTVLKKSRFTPTRFYHIFAAVQAGLCLTLLSGTMKPSFHD